MDSAPEEAGDEDEPWSVEAVEFDPDSLAPEGPEPPEARLEEVDVPADLQRAFWAAVLLVNVGLAAISLAAMFAYFRGRFLLSGGLLVLGAGSLAHAYRVYRGYVDSDGETS